MWRLFLTRRHHIKNWLIQAIWSYSKGNHGPRSLRSWRDPTEGFRMKGKKIRVNLYPHLGMQISGTHLPFLNILWYTLSKWKFLSSPNGCVCAKSFQSSLTLYDTVDCSLPGSSVHGIPQARILKWVAMPSSRRSSWLKDQTHISYIFCIGRQVLYQ